MSEQAVIALDDLPAVRRKVERLQQRSDQAKGALRHLMARLKEEFGCSTVQEAKAMLVELQAEEQAASEAYVRQYRKFKAKWKTVLEDDGP